LLDVELLLPYFKLLIIDAELWSPNFELPPPDVKSQPRGAELWQLDFELWSLYARLPPLNVELQPPDVEPLEVG